MHSISYSSAGGPLTYVAETFLRVMGIPPSDNPSGVMFTIIMLTGMLTILARITPKLVKRLWCYRLIRNPTEQLNGDWIQIITKGNQTYISCISIIYHWQSDKYSWRGTAFDENLEKHATFVSTWSQMGFEPPILEVLYDATFANGDRTGGYHRTIFSRAKTFKFIYGTGHLIDFEADLKKELVDSRKSDDQSPEKQSEVVRKLLPYDLKRLPRLQTLWLIGKLRAVNNEDHAKLVAALRQRKWLNVAYPSARGING